MLGGFVLGNKPIVLTQADVARLTAQGVIKCAPPPAKQAKTSSSHTVASVPVAAKPADHQTAPANMDVRPLSLLLAARKR